jgi:Kef-type K+ transport system membrane component KefB
MSQDEILLYLLIDMVIIIIAARTLGWLVTRVGQPAVIGEILAGILLGPTVLGHIASGAPASLFPKAVPLDSIANLGLIFFMFLVGLELDPRLMRAQGRRAIEISLSGIVAPLLLGILIGTLLVSVNNGGAFLAGTVHPPKTSTFALFIGASMCITAFPVLARILVDRQIYKTAVGTASLCAAAVDDAIAWILLAAVVGIARTGSPLAAGRTFLLALLFVGFMFVIARRGLDLLARRYDVLGRLSVDQVAVVLAGVLLAAFVTEKIGIHAIFGAFLFGAVMPKRSGMTRELTDKVEDFALIVLLPIFFAVTGLRTNLFSLNSPSLIGWLAVIVVVATVGKFAGVGIAARLTGSSGRDAATIGALMNTRGLTELVILSIGLSLGVLSDRTFAMMVIMALATTVMAAPIVNRLLPRERVLRELAAVHGEPEPVAARILVALGNPLNAASLVDVAIRLTGVRRPAELLLVRLIPTPRAPEFRTGLLDEESQVAASVDSMRRLVEQAAAQGVQARPISFLSSDVGADLARVATDQQCDTILLGWYRPSLPRHVIQALVHRTMALAACQVAVFMDREGRGLRPESGRPVLVALSGGGYDGAAVEEGVRLAQSLGADLRLIGYLGHHGQGERVSGSEDLALRADEIRRSSGVWVVPEFAEGNALGAAIDESARAVAGVAGLDDGWLDAADFGVTVTELAQEAGCPMLIVRGPGHVASGEKGPWLRLPRLQRHAAVAGQH